MIAKLNELWDQVDLIPIGTRINIFILVLSFVSTAGFFYAIGRDAGENLALSPPCVATTR